MKRNKAWRPFTGSKNGNELTKVSGVLENDYHSIPAGTRVMLTSLPSDKLTVANMNSDEGEFYWTSPVQSVTLDKLTGLVITTRNSVIRVKVNSYLEAINFRRVLLAKLEKNRQLA